MILAVCPPHAAVEVARSMPPFAGVYLDAKAVSPTTARTIAGLVSRYVEGGIIGPPPRNHGTTRVYLSGDETPVAVDLFAGTIVETRVVSEQEAARWRPRREPSDGRDYTGGTHLASTGGRRRGGIGFDDAQEFSDLASIVHGVS